jgi:malonyl-CoA decarboxylase
MASEAPPRVRLQRLLRPFRRNRGLELAPGLPPSDTQRLVKAIEGLLAQRETTAQRAAALELVNAYGALDVDGRGRFLETLATRFGPDAAALDRAASSMARATNAEERAGAERDLRKAITPQYAKVLHIVTGLPDGVRLLVALRADLLAMRRKDAVLGLLADELTGHLTTLFDVGLLELRQITWDSPASVLQRLMATEAVHAIRSWNDLRHRLEGDQRVYALFHPALALEPIVFVEVALTHGLADDLPHLLERERPDADHDTAIFYSITSAQPGLAGVHLGNELIKLVVDELRREHDDIKTFATLSPLPGFRAWLTTEVEESRLTPFERDALRDDAAAVVSLADRSWTTDRGFADRIRPGVLSAAARYASGTRDGRALDPVANFHLSNGASVERLNWLANPAEYGMDESLGLMVNYLYDRDRIAANADAYLRDATVRASTQVRNLVKTLKS